MYHRWSHPRLKRMRARERAVDRVLTKLEGIARVTRGKTLVMLVLPDWLARVVYLAGYQIGEAHHCKGGIFWHSICVRGV